MELTNLDLVARIHKVFNKHYPEKAKAFEDIYDFVTDRKDMTAYAIDTTFKISLPRSPWCKFRHCAWRTVNFFLAGRS